MATRINVGMDMTKAEPWTEGKIIAGEFEGAAVLPEVSSRKLTFRTRAGRVAVWETATLKSTVDVLKPGTRVMIVCLGKTLETKHATKAWAFDVLTPDDEKEWTQMQDQYAAYVAGGGK